MPDDGIPYNKAKRPLMDDDYIAWLESRVMSAPATPRSRTLDAFLLGFIVTGAIVISGRLAGVIDMSNGAFAASTAGLFLGIAFYGFNYLEGGQRAISKSLSKIGLALGPLAVSVKYHDEPPTSNIELEIGELKARVFSLTSEINELRSTDRTNNYDEISSRLKAQVLRDASNDLINNVEKRLSTFITSDYHQAQQALQPFLITRDRISYALERLNRRGAFNLLAGGLVTLSGIILLGYFIAIEKFSDANATQFLMHFAPRLAIVTFVQVFAFFFLKLYKLGLEEIKYFQNELTNIEQKETAISLAMIADDSSLKSEILKIIAKTDRNNVLDKGQSTVEIEKAKLEKGGSAIEVLQAIAPVLAKK